MPPDTVLDPILRKSTIRADLGIDNSTLSAWIKRDYFPKPLVLNPGQKREIVGWPTSVYLAWKASLPQRLARPISNKAYSEQALAKRRRTLAEKRGSNGGLATTEPVAEGRDPPPPESEPSKPRRQRPRS